MSPREKVVSARQDLFVQGQQATPVAPVQLPVQQVIPQQSAVAPNRRRNIVRALRRKATKVARGVQTAKFPQARTSQNIFRKRPTIQITLDPLDKRLFGLNKGARRNTIL